MNKCLECNQETNNPKFCSRSCATKSTNRNRVDKCPNKNGTKICKCIKCETEVEVNIRHRPAEVKCDICKQKPKCSYCNKLAIIQFKNGNWCCELKACQCPIIRRRTANGLRKNHADGVMNSFGMKNKNYIPINFGKRIRSDEEIFTDNNSRGETGLRKTRLIEERGHCCEECKNHEWLNQIIPLELHHENGVNSDNRKENLKLLCHNCHALTPNWRGKGKTRNKKLRTDKEIINAIRKSENLNQVITFLGLKHGNEPTIINVMVKYKLNFGEA